jgi:Ca2+-binding RTX toxin-like protein
MSATRPLLALTVLVLGLPGGASAATVSATTQSHIDAPGKGWPETLVTNVDVHVDAAPGESNLVTVYSSEGVLRVRDAASPPVAGAGCTQAAPDTVTCGHAARSGESVGYSTTASLGDGDDSWVSYVPSHVVDGGAGNDRISASSGRILGGAGDDVLTATKPALGETSAVVDGGPGADRMTGGTVTYATRTEAITVDLADTGPDGAAGEGDVVTGVDALIGGRGGDVLLGTNGRDNLDGGGGTDRLDGRGGDDVLDDVGTGSAIACGAGFDAARADKPRVRVARDCERLEPISGLDVKPRPTFGRGAARLRVLASCVDLAFDDFSSCLVRVELRGTGGRLLGVGTTQRGRRSGPFTVSVPLRVRPRAHEPLYVRLLLRDRSGHRESGSWISVG